MTSCYSHDVRSASCSADTVVVNQPQAETKLSLLWVLQYTHSFPSTPWGFDAFKRLSVPMGLTKYSFIKLPGAYPQARLSVLKADDRLSGEDVPTGLTKYSFPNTP